MPPQTDEEEQSFLSSKPSMFSLHPSNIPSSSSRILGRILFDQYDYYNLKNSVPLPDDDRPNANIVQDCLNSKNWEKVSAHDGVDALAPTLSNTRVCLVIQPEGDAESAIANLDANYAEVFSSLQITVSILQRWSREDVNNNLGGGRWWRASDVHGVDFSNAISHIEQALAERRTYIVQEDGEMRDYKNAQDYATHFNDIFVAAPKPPGKATNQKFATFFDVPLCFDEDSDRITNDRSSAMKASNLEKLWGFPIFDCTRDQPEAWCRFSPWSDFMVLSRSFLCPFLISEVVSDDNDESN